ncbi:LamG-like jellyroll fold domain-containing protein [Streptomyces sp. MspMP-M5]|uniref:protein kinase domain-containing protein n=1 Tax=unclassified Streptomyces TaxID=2593676 RepID=UPI00035CC2E7|nr:LamG-like jellyroll fold domain-containing protein [Streptomyces sp. MspMP-M5]MYT33873.1 protein kinase [Streptomyces sp. SID8354]
MAALDPDDPRSIGGYQLLERLGAGGMGRVFLGRSPGGRQVAVKVVHAALLDQPDFRSRFRREVQAARAVSGAFTAPVIDADPDAPEPWLVTSYISGPSLERAVSDWGPMPTARVFALAAGLAEALVSIHGAHLVHRDLKPSNVLLATDGPRVIDFGIARVVEGSSLTMTGFALGSPGFMSPEQANGEEIGPPSDVFSLGTVLAYAATGGNPFGDGHLASLLYRVVHDTPDLDTVTDPALRTLITDCLAKDPARRPTPREILGRCGAGAGAEVGPAAAAPSGAESSVHPGAPGGAPPPGRRPGGGLPAAPTAPGTPLPGAAPTPAPSVHRTPAAGALPAPGRAQMTDAQLRPAGSSGRRGATRRTLLISAAAAAAVAAVGIPMALTASHDSAPGDEPARPTGPKPVGTWRLDEHSGHRAADAVGAHDGTASDVRWGVGNSGAALFNGVSSQITTRGPVLDTAPGHSFTVSAWVYLTSASGFATIVSQGAADSSSFYLQYSGSDHRWAFSRPGVRTLGAEPPVLNTWTHLVGVCDAAAHRLHLYVNGRRQGTATDTRPDTKPGALMIGRATFGGRPVDFFSGSIKNVQVFDQALPAERVTALERGGVQ